MKKFIIVLALALISGVSFAQIKSSVIKNTAGTEVFSIGYGSGAATVTVNDVISAGSISLSSSNVLTSTHPVIGAGTNTAAAGGIRVTVNGTNYIIRLFAN